MNTMLLVAALLTISTPVQTVKETVIVVQAPAPKRLVCGAPHAMLNDAVQTVRVCEFK